MRTSGASSDFIPQRNADLIRAFRAVILAAPAGSVASIWEAVASSPAQRFYTSGARAAAVISAIEAGRPLPRMRQNKKEMFLEIYRRYQVERNLCPDAPLIELASRVVWQPAPKFYLTPRSVAEIIYRIRAGFYNS